MSKVQLHELAEALCKKRGLTQEESARFAAAMFDVIRDSLAVEGLVKVKGLGTFKVVGVEARESVSVNTGERIVIDGHEKVTFTPDAEMKEMVNRPFSQFETVELNEGVTFDESEELRVKSEESEGSEECRVKSEEFAAAIPSAESEESEGSEELRVKSEESEESEECRVKSEEFPTGVPVGAVEGMAAANSSLFTLHSSLPTGVPVGAVEGMAAANSSLFTLHSSLKTNTDNNMTLEDYDNEEKPRSRSWMLWIALVLVAAGAAYYIGLRQSNAPKNIEYVEADAPKVRHESAAAATEPAVPERPVAAAATEPAVPERPAAAAATEPAVPERPAAAENYDKYEQMDARVRTGAYRIKGTDRVVKARRGDNLERIARRELGEGMVCYVSVYNQLADDAELSEGQQIKIPKLEWKRKARK